MTRKLNSEGVEGFAGLVLKTRYSSVDDPIDGFYVPVLSRAVAYDRVAGYFSSSSFVTAAAGLSRFISNDGRIRLLIGAQLTAADRDALLGDAPLDEVLARRLLHGDVLEADQLARRRFEVIAWLVRAGRLEIRVGLPCDSGGMPLAGNSADAYFHSKWGVVTDAAGDRVVFEGSVNESDAGWRLNFETFSVYPSWRAEVWADYGQGFVDDFERMWSGGPVGTATGVWRTVALPAAVRDRLIDLLPGDPGWRPSERDPLQGPTPDEQARLEEIRNAPRTRTGVGLVSAGVEPWPHQMRIAGRITSTWPRSYLLADEVGLGKTIEAGLVLRELLLSGEAATALLLVPASVLIQWQEELAEKFLLDVPRLEARKLRWADPDRPDRDIPAGANRWRAAPVLLASSHLARRRDARRELLDGDGWDVVLLDEAHHARRRGGTARRPSPRTPAARDGRGASAHPAGGSANQMLATLRALRGRGMWRMLLLASATPMQLHSHDLWDLLDLCGLPPEWDRDPAALERYYTELLRPFEERDWRFLQNMLAGHLSQSQPDATAEEVIKRTLGWVQADRVQQFHVAGINPRRSNEIKRGERSGWELWLRANTPVRDRVFRTTRGTLREYLNDGILPASTVIPERGIHDEFLPLGEARPMYDRIEDYITRHYDAYLRGGGASKPLGFIMTVYRRRLTSSFHAIRCSLERRRGVLRHRLELVARLDSTRTGARTAGIGEHPRQASAGLLDEDDLYSLENTPGLGDLNTADPAAASADIEAELAELDDFIAGLRAMPPDEPKMRCLHQLLFDSFNAGHRTAVVFTQYADTLRYVRERLLTVYGTQIICYYNGRGERWNPAAAAPGGDAADTRTAPEGQDESPHFGSRSGGDAAGTHTGSGAWERLSKEDVKTLFREGEEVRILLGTDSMSEGLNLQTCDRLVNFDLPWNFMRVEQRIGRVDRIGGQPLVEVTNLFYDNTVEEDIYRRILDRHDWFTNVVGSAQPVLAASVESVMQRAAMRRSSVSDAVEELAQTINRTEEAPITIADLDSVPEHDTRPTPAMDLPGLRQALLSIAAVQDLLQPHPDWNKHPTQASDSTTTPTPGRTNTPGRTAASAHAETACHITTNADHTAAAAHPQTGHDIWRLELDGAEYAVTFNPNTYADTPACICSPGAAPYSISYYQQSPNRPVMTGGFS